MRGNDGIIFLSEKDRAKVWKAHMPKVMNEENEWDKMAEADTVHGSTERVLREEIMEAFKHSKIVKASGPSEVYAEMILAGGDVGIRALMEPCLKIQDGKGMPADLVTSIAIPIFIGKGDVMNCGMHRGIKLLERAIEIVEKVLEKIEKGCNNG